MNFETLGLKPALVAGLEKQGFTQCIGLQDQMVTAILANKNVMVCAQTGSGKTLGYLLPIFERQQTVANGLQAVILVPTHELGLQVHQQIELLAANSGIPMRSAAVFGNTNIDLQIKKLKTKPQFVVGTPGRVLDLMQKKHIPAHLAQTIIVDEGDMLFHRENAALVVSVIKKAQRDTQLVVVSASISEETRQTVAALGKQPEMLSETQTARIPESITHIRIDCEERDKPECLRKLMAALHPGHAIAIVNNRDLLEKVATKLQFHHLSADFIHADSTRQDRQRIMEAFKKGKLTLLLATDLAARGLAFDDIDIVFCLTASEEPSDYLHRAGRTGRCGKAGVCISLVSEREVPLYHACEKQFGFQMQKKRLREGRLIAPDEFDKKRKI